MSERERPVRRSRPATDVQAARGRENLAKGTAKRMERARKAKESGAPSAKEKWAMLLSGQMTVRDMDDEELARMQFRSKAGDFSGSRRKTVPSHIAQQVMAEKMRRADAGLKDLLPTAVKALSDILTSGADGEVIKTSDVNKAIAMVLERGLGKVEQKVDLKVTETPWDAVVEQALDIDRDLEEMMDDS